MKNPFKTHRHPVEFGVYCVLITATTLVAFVLSV